MLSGILLLLILALHVLVELGQLLFWHDCSANLADIFSSQAAAVIILEIVPRAFLPQCGASRRNAPQLLFKEPAPVARAIRIDGAANDF
jgi:hypothetical protein